jgi:predicted  nucleic acid-binding Zn-ribbon protein
MAGRSSIGVGVGTAIFLLAVSTLAFLVLWAMYFSKYKDAEANLQTARADVAEFIGAGERNQDWVRSLVTQAKGSKKSVVQYLQEGTQNTMQAVTGVRSDTPATLEKKLEAIEAAKNKVPLLTIIKDLTQTVSNTNVALQRAEADRAAANENLKNETARVTRIEAEHKATVETLTAQIAQYRGEVEENRAGTEQYKQNLDTRVTKAEGEFSAEKKRLNDSVSRLKEENLILRNQLLSLRAERNKEILRPADEFSLVDAQVIGVDGAEHKAFISIGEQQRVRLGMTFTVYADASSIRPDDAGNYPRGKATMEVINVGPSSATCRITSEVRGNPVVSGDVVANAVYDPKKVYKFVIYGNFDINRDGFPSPGERNDLKALVEAWGGRSSDELAGDADFLILGERPILPPQPASDAPFEVFQEFVRQQQAATKYDDLYRKASETSVPILNENRLYTLIGKSPAMVSR